jgi:outer membrane protein assembly factor BamB
MITSTLNHPARIATAESKDSWRINLIQHQNRPISDAISSISKLIATLLLFLPCNLLSGQEREAAKSEVGDKKVVVSNLWTRKAGEDWPSFLGPRGNGSSSEQGIVTDWKASPPRVVWSKKLGTSYGIGATSRGRYFQFCRHGDNERLTCYNAETGEELWKWEASVEYRDMYGYNNGPRTSPVIDDDRVYIFGVTGRLACLSVTTGAVLWERMTNDEYNVIPNFFGVGSTPVVIDDLLWVMIGGSPPSQKSIPEGQLDAVKGNGCGVVAFDKRTGKEVYRLSDELASYSSLIATPGLKKQGVDLLCFARGGLLGISGKDGAEKFYYPWRSSTMESVNAACPIVSGDEILISETYSIGSSLLKLQDGKATELWKDPVRQRDQAFRAHWATPILVDGYLYGCSGRNQPDADLRCIRWSDGKVMWAARTHERMSLLLVDNHLVVLGEEGRLLLMKVNPQKPEVIGELDLSTMNHPEDGEPMLTSPCWAAPILSHGLMYVRGNDRVICLELIPEKK